MRALLLLALLSALVTAPLTGCVYDFNRSWDAGAPDASQPDQRLTGEAGGDAPLDTQPADGPVPDTGLKVLSSKPILICSQTKSNCKAPDVAFDGTKFLVVWQDDRSATTGNDIYGKLVASDGVVGNEITISVEQKHQNTPAVTYGGASPHFLVAWHDLRGGAKADIWARWITTTGGGGANFMVSGDSREETNVALAAGDTNLLAAWRSVDISNGQDIVGARIKYDVDPLKCVIDSTPLKISQKEAEELDPTVAYDGANFLVAWQDTSGADSGDIHGVRFTELTGAVLASDKTGSDHGIAICNGPNTQRQPAVAFLKKVGYQLIWSDRTAVADEDDIMGARVPVGSTLKPAPVVTISGATSVQDEPTIAAGKAGFLAVWVDDRSTNQIYASRIDQGKALDSKGVAIAPASFGASETPAIAYDSNNGQYLVVWSELETYRKVYGVRVEAP